VAHRSVAPGIPSSCKIGGPQRIGQVQRAEKGRGRGGDVWEQAFSPGSQAFGEVVFVWAGSGQCREELRVFEHEEHLIQGGITFPEGFGAKELVERDSLLH
jgi:hypothetical protein